MLMRLGAPLGLASNNHKLYIAEAFKGRIIEIDINTKKTKTTKLITKLSDPFALIFNKGKLFVSDPIEGKIVMIENITTNPKITDLIVGVEAYGLAIKNNYLYAALRDENKVIKIDITSIHPIVIDVITNLYSPFKLAFHKNDLYIANGCKISKINRNDKSLEITDLITTSNKVLGMAFKDNELFFTSSASNKIVKTDISKPSLVVKDVITNLSAPHSLLFNNDELFFSDISNSGRVFKFNVKSTNAFEGIKNSNLLKVYQNLNKSFITVKGLKRTQHYQVFNPLGNEISKGFIKENAVINIKDLDAGSYFLKFDYCGLVKFLKE